MRKIGMSLLCTSLMWAGAVYAQGTNDLTLKSADGTVSATFKGEGRIRYETRSPSGFAVDRTTSMTLLRTRFGVDVKMPEDHNFMLQFQDVRAFGNEPAAAANTDLGGDGASLDVLQAYYYNKNLFGEGIEAYIGRQKFTVGNERLFSTLEWSQTSRSWDGVRLCKSLDAWSLRGFVLVTDFEDEDEADGFASDQRYNLGATIGYTGVENHEIEFFVLHDIRQGDQTAPGVFVDNGPGTTTSLSLRIDGKQWENTISYSLEGVIQTGSIDEGTGGGADTDISTFAVFANLAYHHALEGSAILHVMGGIDLTSGDDDATDDEMETFFAPYPFGHKYTGYADVVGYSNLRDVYVSLKYKSSAEWALELAGHSFTRTEGADAAYTPAGGVALAGASDEKDIGMELDAVFDYAWSTSVAVQIGWSYFFAGDYVDDLVADNNDIDFLWASLNVKF